MKNFYLSFLFLLLNFLDVKATTYTYYTDNTHTVVSLIIEVDEVSNEITIDMKKSGAFYYNYTYEQSVNSPIIPVVLNSIEENKITVKGGDWTEADMGYFRNYMKTNTTCKVYDWGLATMESDGVFNFDGGTQSTIEKIIMPHNLEHLSANAFEDCTNLKSVTWSYNLKTIGEDAFWGCSSITSIYVPEGVTSIGHAAFGDMSSLKYVVLPRTLENIAQDVFLMDNPPNNNSFTDLYSLGTPAALERLENNEDFNSTSGWNREHERSNNYVNWTLHVEEEYENQYKEAYGWRLFFNYENDFPDIDPDDDEYVIYLRPTDTQRPQYTGIVNNTKSVYTREMKDDRYYTICLPFPISSTLLTQVFGTGTKVYQYGGVKNSCIMFTQEVTIGGMNADTPYLIKPGKWANRWEFSFRDVEYTDHNSVAPLEVEVNSGVDFPSTFTGTYQNQKIPVYAWYIKNNVFYYMPGENTSKGWKAYGAVIMIDGTNEGSVKSMNIDFGDSMNKITDVQIGEDLQGREIFNLMGQKVDTPNVHGIYIINGKKVYFK